MTSVDSARGGGRETRLLLVTIAVSICALVLLAQFRFPEEAAQPVVPAPAPLERLAARAAYDELAAAMADLERRIAPRVLVLRVSPDGSSNRYVVAPRLTSTRAVALVGQPASIEPVADVPAEVVSVDPDRGLAVLTVPAAEDGMVTPRTGPPRQGPRYVVAVEGTEQGPTLRPVYVGRVTQNDGAASAMTLLNLDGLQMPIPVGAALFSLEGTFLGLVSGSGPVTPVITAEFLKNAAETAHALPSRPHGYFGVHVQNASPALLRAAGAERGLIVTHVEADGPAWKVLRPGDVLQFVDNQAIESIEALRRIERSRAPGSALTLRFVRRGAEQQATLRAADAAAAGAPAAGPGFSGRSVAGVGVEVVAVDKQGPAAAAGLKRGDLIRTMNGDAVASVATILRAYRNAKPGTAILLSVERGEQHQVIALEKR